MTLTSSQTSPARPVAWLWGPVIAYCALIFVLSSIPGLPDLPAHMSDKVAHMLLYSGLGFLVARARSRGIGRPVSGATLLVVLAFTALYGLSDETHQLFVPNRQFDLKDMAADVVGGAVGAVALWGWGILRRSHDVI